MCSCRVHSAPTHAHRHSNKKHIYLLILCFQRFNQFLFSEWIYILALLELVSMSNAFSNEVENRRKEKRS